MYGFLILAEWRLKPETELVLEAWFVSYSHVGKNEYFTFLLVRNFPLKPGAYFILTAHH